MPIFSGTYTVLNSDCSRFLLMYVRFFLQYHKWASEVQRGKGKVPVADYRVATTINDGKSKDEVLSRGCYSFCMCPGGQVRPL